jgi:hypothetical protein
MLLRSYPIDRRQKEVANEGLRRKSCSRRRRGSQGSKEVPIGLDLEELSWIDPGNRIPRSFHLPAVDVASNRNLRTAALVTVPGRTVDTHTDSGPIADHLDRVQDLKPVHLPRTRYSCCVEIENRNRPAADRRTKLDLGSTLRRLVQD